MGIFYVFDIIVNQLKFFESKVVMYYKVFKNIKFYDQEMLCLEIIFKEMKQRYGLWFMFKDVYYGVMFNKEIDII